MYNEKNEQDEERCRSKIAYGSKAEAIARAQALRAVYGSKSYPYLCKVCGCYHLATDKSPDYPTWQD